MAIPFGLNLVLVFVISLFFLRLLFWRTWRYRNLPPGPPAWPIVGNLLQLRSPAEFERSVKKFHERYGPIFTVWLGFRPLMIITAREIAHEALIQKGSVFADRPSTPGTRQIFTSNQHSINSAAYGPLWRSLRRNLVSEALRPSAMKAFGEVREWGMDRLLQNLKNEAARNGGSVSVVAHLRTAVFQILLSMCFGSKPNEETVITVQGVLRDILQAMGKDLEEDLPIPGFFFQRRRARIAEIRQRQREALLPLINKRRNAPSLAGGAYVDTLLTLTVDSGRSLNDDELVTLCSEFITAGTDTTTTSLEWLMANLVIRQDVQARLYDEIVGVTGGAKSVEEDELQQMPYLEAVVKENLRRHPPTHFVLTHAVTGPCKLAGYDVPANAFVNFFVAGMGMDPAVWPNPSKFRPERFFDEGVEVDLTGTKEIQMMPFGAGRRVCPGLGMSMFHLNLIVARLVQEFAWECKPGMTVDLSEADEFTTVMKYPLQAVINERREAYLHWWKLTRRNQVE